MAAESIRLLARQISRIRQTPERQHLRMLPEQMKKNTNSKKL